MLRPSRQIPVPAAQTLKKIPDFPLALLPCHQQGAHTCRDRIGVAHAVPRFVTVAAASRPEKPYTESRNHSCGIMIFLREATGVNLRR